MTKAGTTKIEILTALLLIGILGVVAVGAVSNARSRTRDAVRLSDVRQVQAGLELYFNDFNTYPVPTDVTPLGQASTRCLSENGFSASCTPSLETVYMDVVSPTPTKGLKKLSSCGGVTNAYCYLADDQSYVVQFELENNLDALGLTKGLNCARETGIEAGGC